MCLLFMARLKKIVLNAYWKISEAYRQHFRRCQKASGQTYVEFFHQKQLLCRRWVKSSLHSCDYDVLLELIFMKEIKSCLASKVRAHLDERELHILVDAGPAADNLSLTNIDSFHRNQPVLSLSVYPSILHWGLATIGECAGRGRGTTDNPWERRTVTCSYCKTSGHHINFCKSGPVDLTPLPRNGSFSRPVFSQIRR